MRTQSSLLTTRMPQHRAHASLERSSDRRVGKGARPRGKSELKPGALPTLRDHAGVTPPAHFDKTKPTARRPRVMESSGGVGWAKVRTRCSPLTIRMPQHRAHASLERSRDRRVGKARKAARQIRIEARRLVHPTGVTAGVTLPAHFDKTKPTARMPRVTESSPRSRVGKGADPELASHHTNGAAPCPRVTREVERPTRGQGAQGRTTNEN